MHPVARRELQLASIVTDLPVVCEGCHRSTEAVRRCPGGGGWTAGPGRLWPQLVAAASREAAANAPQPGASRACLEKPATCSRTS